MRSNARWTTHSAFIAFAVGVAFALAAVLAGRPAPSGPSATTAALRTAQIASFLRRSSAPSELRGAKTTRQPSLRAEVERAPDRLGESEPLGHTLPCAPADHLVLAAQLCALLDGDLAEDAVRATSVDAGHRCRAPPGSG